MRKSTHARAIPAKDTRANRQPIDQTGTSNNRARARFRCSGDLDPISRPLPCGSQNGRRMLSRAGSSTLVAFALASVCECMCACMHACMYDICMGVCVYMYMYVCTCLHTHMYIHPSTPPSLSLNLTPLISLCRSDPLLRKNRNTT